MKYSGRSNLVFYRKYRPQKFGEFLNQEHIKQTIKNAISLGRIAHGYLFTGPRGTGKTTLARLIAKAVNCQNRQPAGVEPCNSCELCSEVTEGRSLDLIEIDAASNRGIDEIRELREGIRFSPVKARYKVFIIDEAHMLTKEAFNALLKTLEEPPEHAIFILATTEPERLPATIVSRTQRFDFKRLTLPDILAKLERIAKAEDLEAEPEALRMIAASAEGSIRDAESLFAQVVAFTTEKSVTLRDVEEILGAMNFTKLQGLISHLAASDAAASIKFLGDAVEQGYDVSEMSRTLLANLRKILFLKIDPSLAELFSRELSKDDVAVLAGFAQNFDADRLRLLIKGLMQATPMIKRAVIPTLPVELAILEALLKK